MKQTYCHSDSNDNLTWSDFLKQSRLASSYVQYIKRRRTTCLWAIAGRHAGVNRTISVINGSRSIAAAASAAASIKGARDLASMFQQQRQRVKQLEFIDWQFRAALRCCWALLHVPCRLLRPAADRKRHCFVRLNTHSLTFTLVMWPLAAALSLGPSIGCRVDKTVDGCSIHHLTWSLLKQLYINKRQQSLMQRPRLTCYVALGATVE